VLDPDDTAATRWTVDALMRRRDAAALEVIAAALPSADCDHARWIDSGIREALGWAEWTWAEALEVCDELPETAGSSQLSGLLSELKPDKQTGW
jgi:hypothetical protein